MRTPSLHGLTHWMDATLLDQVDSRRKADGEVRRNRKLGTVQTLWLMLAVALNAGTTGLHEILRHATAELDIPWQVTVSAFCKARKRFSPPASAVPARALGARALPPPWAQPGAVEGAYAQGR